MSYTPPSPVAFDFTAGGYSAPSGSALDLSISGPVAFIGTPTQGVVNFTGLTPSALAAGFQDTATALQISLTGLTPGAYFGHFIGQPAQGVVNFTGLMPSALAAGFEVAATALQIDLIGLLPIASFSFPFTGQPAQGIVNFTGLTPSALIAGFEAVPTTLQIDFTGLTPIGNFGRFIGQPIQGLINFNGLTPSALATGFAGIPSQAYLDWIGNLPTLITRNVNDPPANWIAVRYRCFLTPPDSTVFDIELPISSFQSRLRLNGLSYLSVVLKGADAYAAKIVEAANRKMRIFREYHYLDGYINSTLIAASDYETLQINEGEKSGTTATLSGNGDMVPSNFAIIALKNPTYRSAATGSKRYRCAIDARLRPGDTAQINGETFTVNEIVYIIDTKTSIMEISA
jgi:hypothetical protein